MRATLSYQVECSSVQHATALRDQTASHLQDQGITVVTSNMARETRTYRVLGVDVTSKESFAEITEAIDEDKAVEQVIGNSHTKVVAEVRET